MKIVKVTAVLFDPERNVRATDVTDTSHYDFEITAESTEFQWNDNNYSCDCNRSLFLSRLVPGYVERPCNARDPVIKLESLTVTYEDGSEEQLSTA